ncbi:MAG TPA: flagellar basal body P-ring formation chaperone FlgA [Vicinamibacterales bacterium]|nr:flagellar basal body P-ring formation chaperone FlgA [Vicinamibacterales bacterium]
MAWAAGVLAASPQVGEADQARVHAAIVEAVRARVGGSAEVRVEDIVVKSSRDAGGREGPLSATPEPGARAGRPARFSLATRSATSAGTVRGAGHVVATVFVAADCVRAARPVRAGAVLSADDLVSERSDLGGMPLQRPPVAAEVLGARVNRPLQAGELLLARMVTVPRLVQSGDVVTIRVRAEGVEAEGRGVATQSGGAGDAIRVVNSTSRRAIKARVVGPNEVEVIR